MKLASNAGNKEFGSSLALEAHLGRRISDELE
jgi:hypothetical protein